MRRFDRGCRSKVRRCERVAEDAAVLHEEATLVALACVRVADVVAVAFARRLQAAVGVEDLGEAIVGAARPALVLEDELVARNVRVLAGVCRENLQQAATGVAANTRVRTQKPTVICFCGLRTIFGPNLNVTSLSLSLTTSFQPPSGISTSPLFSRRTNAPSMSVRLTTRSPIACSLVR